MLAHWFRGVVWLAVVETALFAVYCAALLWSGLSRLRRWWRGGLAPLK